MKNLLIYYGKKIYDRGLSPATSGNISLRDSNGTILITSSGSSLGDLNEADIIRTNSAGKILEGDKKPSGELLMHLKIYKKRPDIKALIHSHSPEITAFAAAWHAIDKPVLPDFVLCFDKIPLVPYFMPTSLELADEVGRYFEKYNAVLMANHGIMLGNTDIKQAFYSLETVQAYCKTYIYAGLIGKIKPLGTADIDRIKRHFIKK